MTSIRLLKNGFEAFPAMFNAMDQAQASIALEMYIVEDDETGREFRNHLVHAAQQGIEVLVLVDDRIAYIGGINIAEEYYHGAHGELPWRDNMLEIIGPSAGRLRRLFARIWAKADSPYRRLFQRQANNHVVKASNGNGVHFLESGPENAMRPVRAAYRQLVKSATKNIDLAMSYFYPHGRMLHALKQAAKRGVPVRLLFPEKSDVAIAQ